MVRIFAAIMRDTYVLSGQRNHVVFRAGVEALARGRAPESPEQFLDALHRVLRDVAQAAECRLVAAQEAARVETLRRRSRARPPDFSRYDAATSTNGTEDVSRYPLR